jgi:hypothetical protein
MTMVMMMFHAQYNPSTQSRFFALALLKSDYQNLTAGNEDLGSLLRV